MDVHCLNRLNITLIKISLRSCPFVEEMEIKISHHSLAVWMWTDVSQIILVLVGDQTDKNKTNKKFLKLFLN